MIKLIAPTTIETAGDENTTAIIEMDRTTFRGLAVAVEVAFDDAESVPPEYADVATDLWNFFVKGEQS